MDEDWVRKHELGHEQIDTKLDTILEYVSQIPEMNDRLGRVEHRLDGMDGRLTSVEVTLAEHSAILADHSADLKEIKQFVGSHEERLVALELTTS